MRVIGFDPGLERVGWGVVDKEGSRVSCAARGCIVTPRIALAERLEMIHREAESLIALHRPEGGAMEKLFFAKNQTTAMDVARASGVILLACCQAGLAVGELSPPEVKLGIVGHGGAEKKQVQFMIQRLLGIAEPIRPDDTADALAVALAWILRQGPLAQQRPPL